MEGPFMESDECAALIKTTRTAVHNLAHRRKIPYIKCGHRLLFDRNEILQWLEGLLEVSKEEALQRTVRR